MTAPAGTPASRVSGRALKSALLYVSDEAHGDVTIYTFPAGKYVATIEGGEPQGLCSDKTGDVFVPNYRSGETLEYAHGGTTPIATLKDPGGWPIDCAVDPKTGDLAVVDAYTINVYKHVSGKPLAYLVRGMQAFYFCAYDDRGNLFIDGTRFDRSESFGLAELSQGKARIITLNQSIEFPGGVQWDGKYIAVADATAPVVYAFSINGSGGTLERQSDLRAWDLPGRQFWIQGHTLVGETGSYSNQNVGFWRYPSDDNRFPKKTIAQNVAIPYGATVSVGPSSTR